MVAGFVTSKNHATINKKEKWDQHIIFVLLPTRNITASTQQSTTMEAEGRYRGRGVSRMVAVVVGGREE